MISLQPAIFHQKKIINASLETHKNCLSFLQKIDHKTIDPVLFIQRQKNLKISIYLMSQSSLLRVVTAVMVLVMYNVTPVWQVSGSHQISDPNPLTLTQQMPGSGSDS